MLVLMVTAYPPNRDGIAAYAVQSVRALRAQGHQVEVLSPGPSAAHHHLDLVGPRGALALARRVRGYDRVIVQFHPDVFYPPGASSWQRACEGLALATAFRRARAVEVVVHEIDGRHGRRGTLSGLVTRAMWRSVEVVRVHTERDRETFARNFGVPRSRIVVTDHGADFVPRTGYDRAGARDSLGVPAAAFVYLSIGFIQPHKGFDRAVRAFAESGLPDARLDVVGSVRVEEPDFVAYRDELAALVAVTDGAYLHDGFVSDELFDRWIVACDVVVLPYRSIWSSGVLERARLFGRPVIATAVGGLPEQASALAAGQRTDQPAGRDGSPAGPAVVLVSTDAELRRAMRAAAGVDPSAIPRPWPESGVGLWARIQDEIVARAAGHRSRRPARGGPGSVTSGSGGSGAAGSGATGSASAALRRVRSLEMPDTTSARPLARLAKRVVRRLTAW
ncbi:MAG TPA: glycosyltransferase family 4 protein, partial [Mycobacteriales bacterium]|nr:glycosyltransferase family 4 protein [Mycobacteriales bacterium]